MLGKEWLTWFTYSIYYTMRKLIDWYAGVKLVLISGCFSHARGSLFIEVAGWRIAVEQFNHAIDRMKSAVDSGTSWNASTIYPCQYAKPSLLRQEGIAYSGTCGSSLQVISAYFYDVHKKLLSINLSIYYGKITSSTALLVENQIW